MKNKFKLGDILRLVDFYGSGASGEGSYCSDDLKIGDLVKVSQLYPYKSSEPWFEFGGGLFWHPEKNFELVSEGMPGMITVILRRKVDEMPVLKALERLDFDWRGGDRASSWGPWDHGSRVINVHVYDNELGTSPESGNNTLKPSEIEKNILSAEWHSYESVMFLNTKPSVKQVISNLKAILT